MSSLRCCRMHTEPHRDDTMRHYFHTEKKIRMRDLFDGRLERLAQTGTPWLVKGRNAPDRNAFKLRESQPSMLTNLLAIACRRARRSNASAFSQEWAGSGHAVVRWQSGTDGARDPPRSLIAESSATMSRSMGISDDVGVARRERTEAQLDGYRVYGQS